LIRALTPLPNKGVAADERGPADWMKSFRSRAGFRAEHRSMPFGAARAC
jgi:hypothetical protein